MTQISIEENGLGGSFRGFSNYGQVIGGSSNDERALRWWTDSNGCSDHKKISKRRRWFTKQPCGLGLMAIGAVLFYSQATGTPWTGCIKIHAKI